MALAGYSQQGDQRAGFRRASMSNVKYNNKLIGHAVNLSMTRPHIARYGCTDLHRSTGGKAIASNCLELRHSQSPQIIIASLLASVKRHQEVK